MRKRPASITRYSTPEAVAALTAHLRRCNVSAVEISTADGHLRIAATGGADAPSSATAGTPPSAGAAILARAPIAGVFLSGHSLRPGRAVGTGRPVERGQIAGFMRIGPVLVPVLAETAGVADAAPAEPERLAGFGDVLLKARHGSEDDEQYPA